MMRRAPTAVLLVTPGYAQPGDIACLPALRAFVAGLSRRCSVTVMALRYPHSQRPYALDGAEIVPLGGGLLSGWPRVRLLARACRVAEQLATTRRVDIVHAVWADEPGLIATTTSTRTGAAAVVSLAGGELAHIPSIGFGVQLQPIGALLTAISLRQADAVTCGSLFQQRQWAQRVVPGRRAETAAVVPLGVDPNTFRADGPSRDLGAGVHVMHVASRSPVKGHDVLLAAWRRADVARRGASLHLVGAGTESLKALPSGVIAHGEVAHAELPHLLRGADAWIQASWYESQSVALFEAALCGLPIMGTDVGALADSPVAWKRVPAGDVAALAAVLQAVMDDESSRLAAAQAAWHWARAHASTAVTVDRFWAVYETALRRRRALGGV